jgi:hypothetical protein
MLIALLMVSLLVSVSVSVCVVAWAVGATLSLTHSCPLFLFLSHMAPLQVRGGPLSVAEYMQVRK